MTYAANTNVSAYPRGFAAAVLGAVAVAIFQMGAGAIIFSPFVALYALPYALAGSAILAFPTSLIGRGLSVEGAIFYGVTGAIIGFLLLYGFSNTGFQPSLLGALPGAAGGLCWWQFGRRVVLVDQGEEGRTKDDCVFDEQEWLDA